MNTGFTLIKSSHFFAYKKFKLYYQAVNGYFVFYKPAGVSLKDMRIRQRLLPEKFHLQIDDFSHKLYPTKIFQV
jgi:hypothetical protein